MAVPTAVTKEEVLQVLQTVKDPDLQRDIVSLGFVKNLTVQGSEVSFTVELTTPACPVKDQLKQESIDKVKSLKGVEKVQVTMTSDTRSRPLEPKAAVLPQVKNVIAVASGKGGVGKSTVAVNLALALAGTGAPTGLLDSDIYGPSIPLMFGIQKRPEVTRDQRIVPLEQYGIKLMSMGFLSDDKTPVIWRGPMVHGVIQQFLSIVDWGALDYLVIDLPPGTGDAQLTLTQTAPLNGAVIVTTPQQVSLIDARKGLLMFQKVNVPLLGIVENMSYFICGHCKEKTPIFPGSGGRKLAEELKVPFLGEIPIEPEVAVAGDEGKPILLRNPGAEASKAFRLLAGNVAAQLSIVNMKSETLPSFDLQWKTHS